MERARRKPAGCPAWARFSPAAVVGLECDWASRELAVDGRADVPLRHLTSTTSIHGRGGWAERAADLGWDTLAPFGCHPTRPLDHLNGAGLLWRISGGKITGMQSDWATIEIDGVQHIVP